MCRLYKLPPLQCFFVPEGFNSFHLTSSAPLRRSTCHLDPLIQEQVLKSSVNQSNELGQAPSLLHRLYFLPERVNGLQASLRAQDSTRSDWVEWTRTSCRVKCHSFGLPLHDSRNLLHVTPPFPYLYRNRACVWPIYVNTEHKHCFEMGGGLLLLSVCFSKFSKFCDISAENLLSLC